jgi:hypothetical protein
MVGRFVQSVPGDKIYVVGDFNRSPLLVYDFLHLKIAFSIPFLGLKKTIPKGNYYQLWVKCYRQIVNAAFLSV